jgi:hypothetical protein
VKSYRYDAPDAPLATIFGPLSAARRGRLLEEFAKTDLAVRGLVERMKILTSSNWTTGGLTVDDYPGPPRKAALSAYVTDGDALTFGLELVGAPARWYVDADVSVLVAGDGVPRVPLTMETIECSAVDNAAIGLTLASGWLQAVVMSRPPTAEDWLSDES